MAEERKSDIRMFKYCPSKGMNVPVEEEGNAETKVASIENSNEIMDEIVRRKERQQRFKRYHTRIGKRKENTEMPKNLSLKRRCSGKINKDVLHN